MSFVVVVFEKECISVEQTVAKGSSGRRGSSVRERTGVRTYTYRVAQTFV